MLDRNDLESRVQEIERGLRRQRRFALALALVGLLGFLGAASPLQPRVLRVQRLEVVDPDGQVLGGFGLGALPPTRMAGRDVERLGWFLRDPTSQARASGWVEVFEGVGSSSFFLGQEKASTAFTVADGALVGLGCKDHSATLGAQGSESALWFHAGDGWEPVPVLSLSHRSGSPSIRGWDDHGSPTFDIH